MVSDLERQRQENIERNQRALREFQLKEAANSAFGDKLPSSHKATGKSLGAKKRKKRFDTPEIPRRVRNLRRHAISDEDRRVSEAIDKNGDALTTAPAAQQDSRDQARKEGELQLQDLLGKGDWNQALGVMQSMGGKVSQADLFKPDSDVSDKQVAGLRHELGNLVADDRDIKVVPERITSIAFHPSPEKTIVFAGDKMGEVGVWDAGLPQDEGLVNFKFHTRGVATITVDPENTARVYTGSYDGSVRMLDLQAQKSTEALVYEPDVDAGISDFSLVNTNMIYYTTLTGQFGTHDLREKPSVASSIRLSEKKIGGFSVNPLNTNHVATASLDRTLKVWDIRKPYQISDDETEPMGAFLCGTYHSRLSVSASSWNTSGQIVCNGYDNTINVFNLGEQDYGKDGNIVLEPSFRLQHNCQTGRWVSILKARWQERPKDGVQKFVIGNMTRYADVFAGSGHQLAHVDAEHMTAVPAVSQFHRSENWLCGGNASGKVYLWTNERVIKEKDEIKGESEEADVKDEE